MSVTDRPLTEEEIQQGSEAIKRWIRAGMPEKAGSVEPLTPLEVEELRKLSAPVDPETGLPMWGYCSYCGYKAASETLEKYLEEIAAHVETCSRHPLAAARARIRELELERNQLIQNQVRLSQENARLLNKIKSLEMERQDLADVSRDPYDR